MREDWTRILCDNCGKEICMVHKHKSLKKDLVKFKFSGYGSKEKGIWILHHFFEFCSKKCMKYFISKRLPNDVEIYQ